MSISAMATSGGWHILDRLHSSNNEAHYFVSQQACIWESSKTEQAPIDNGVTPGVCQMAAVNFKAWSCTAAI